MMNSDIVKIVSDKPGPTLAIFAGVHGNETAGVFALQNMLPDLTILRGTLYVVFANQPAIEKNVRMIGKNLNRCFYKDNDGIEPEDIRARELMAILDNCDALLDLHMFYDNNGVPFVVCEENAIELAKVFNVDIISTNWTNVEPGGTDGYMYLSGKIGVCVECGPIEKAAEYISFAEQTILQFLRYFNMTNSNVSYSNNVKRIITAQRAILNISHDFKLLDGYRNFQKLEAGQLIAKDEMRHYVAQQGECIIFPHYNARIGEEAYIIGKG
jgi:succinylglutamate desuccinylase